MKALKDLLVKKADDFDTSGIRTDLEVIQAELDRYFEGRVQISKINDTKAVVLAQSAPVAANMRIQKHQLVEDLNSLLKNKLSDFIIRIA